MIHAKLILNGRTLNSFHVLFESRQIQATVMVQKPGESSSPKVENEHPAAEQWVYVLEGHGIALLRRKKVRLEAGSLLLIPRHTPHQIKNVGRGRLVTLNLYSPPAYTRSGIVKPSVQHT